ncbi:zinc-binding dehydrogenase, partial [Stenotrophomonas maltophilia group sp. RNC7]|uniref:zinc-binding dehydrogenase n=1 Tax=Stenotrophomonas maltophilia group sp. RNC7 TaxID=3071467 RepID=UPI0027E0D209
GLGVIGQLIIRWAAHHGAEEILGIDKHRVRLNGASSYANVSSDVGVVPANCFDIVFISCTDPNAVLHGLRICRSGGRIILVAAPSAKISIDLANDVFRKGVSILGAHEVRALNGDETWQSLLDPVFDKIMSKKIILDDLITHRFAVHDVALAYDL